MRNKNKRVRFAEADNVGSARYESSVCDMVNNVKTPVELDRPKTSEYRFYKKALEEVCRNFCCNEEPKEEDSCAKLDGKNHSKEISHSSCSRHWEKRSWPPTDKFSPLSRSASPYASQIPASRGLNLCATEPMWRLIGSQVPQTLASKDTNIHESTPNSPSTISQVQQLVTSKESGLQYQQGEVFSIKRQRLRELAASTLSHCLDDFLSLGSDAILKLLERIGIQKYAGSNRRMFMLSSISNEKHFNCDNTDSDNYVINRARSSTPKDFDDNKLPRSFNFRHTYPSELGSPAFQGEDTAVPILFSSSGSLVPPTNSTCSSLGWPDFYTWNTEELHNGQYKVDKMMLDSVSGTSDHKLVGTCEPFDVTRPTMDSIGDLIETECLRRSKYHTVNDTPSAFSLLGCERLPYVQWRYLNESLFENDTCNLKEIYSKEISRGLENLDYRSYCRHLLLDSNFRKEAPYELVPESSVARITSESFVKWLCDVGTETSSSPLKFLFQTQSYTLQPGLLPGIRSRDFYSSYNMARPWGAEHIVEDDSSQYDEPSFLKCLVESYHYLPQLGSPHSVRPYDGNNVLLYTPSTAKHMSEDVLCASWKYISPSLGVNSGMKSPLALDYS